MGELRGRYQFLRRRISSAPLASSVRMNDVGSGIGVMVVKPEAQGFPTFGEVAVHGVAQHRLQIRNTLTLGADATA